VADHGTSLIEGFKFFFFLLGILIVFYKMVIKVEVVTLSQNKFLPDISQLWWCA
jgi:hypothetical protein